MSCWARYFKRSLVIVAREVSVNSNYWGGLSNVDSVKRGEVRPRYSTNNQDQYRPMFLGRLSRDGVDASTKWFVLTPSPAVQERFQNDWQIYVLMRPLLAECAILTISIGQTGVI